MLLQIKNIEVDSSQVGGTYSEELGGYVTLNKPRVVLQFVRQIIRDLVRPRSDHVCGVSCREITTVILGAPFNENLGSVAPE